MRNSRKTRVLNCVCVALVLLSGVVRLLMKNVETGSKLLCGIMIAVKVLSIAAGSFVFCKAAKKKGALCGAATGAVYSCLCIGVSLLTKTAGLSFAALADVAFAVVFGAVFGIIWVNIFS